MREDLIRNLIPNKAIKNRLQGLLDNEETEFNYKDLVGSSSTSLGTPAKTRAKAVADSLLQITIQPQSIRTAGKQWTDDWTADGFLRWGVTLGFITHERKTDTFSITSTGVEFSRSDMSPEEDPILLQAMLQYPPAVRVLTIIDSLSPNHGANKFEIGNKLGIKGEMGFTSYNADFMQEELVNAISENDRRKIRQDTEGTADKYARMIATWLSKLSLVRASSTTLQTETEEITGFRKYFITLKGKRALNRANGRSSHKRTAKRINWEYLATAAPNRDYLRTRRALLLRDLEESSSTEVLLQRLVDHGFEISRKELEVDLRNLNNIGITVDITQDQATLRDELIGLEIPKVAVTKELDDAHYKELKTNLIRTTDLPDAWYELLDLAYDGRSNRHLEVQTAALFEELLGFETTLLGGGSRPDIISSAKMQFGLIIDTKAYSKGYGKSITQEDAMVRYIEDFQYKDLIRNKTEWWQDIATEIPSNRVYYLWISSFFLPRFEEQVESTSRRTNSRGAAISVEHLLRLTDAYRKGKLSLKSLEDIFSSNQVNSPILPTLNANNS